MTTNRLEFRLPRALLLAAFIFLMGEGSASGDDSCITCHTDEDLLKENLAATQNKTSALQAGSG